MAVFIKGKVVVTDSKIYEFANPSLAEQFIDCMVGMDELSSCGRVPAVKVSARPESAIASLWAKVADRLHHVSSRVT